MAGIKVAGVESSSSLPDWAVGLVGGQADITLRVNNGRADLHSARGSTELHVVVAVACPGCGGDCAFVHCCDQRQGIMVGASFRRLQEESVIGDLVSCDEISRGIVQGVGSVGIHTIRNYATVEVREILVREGVSCGIQCDRQKVADRSCPVVGRGEVALGVKLEAQPVANNTSSGARMWSFMGAPDRDIGRIEAN